jgi:hypothetical protein
MKTYSISLRAFSVVALVALPLALSAQSVLVDFDSAASITDNLNKGQLADSSDGIGFSGMGDVTYSASTGLSTSGAGATPPEFGDIWGYNTKTVFDSAFGSATISTYFQVKDGKNTGGGYALNMGFSSLAAVEFGNGGGTTGSSTGIPDPTPQNAANQYSFAITLRQTSAAAYDGVNDFYNITGTNNGSSSGIGTSTGVQLSIGGWYFMESTIVRTGDDYAIDAKVFASESSGTITGSSVMDYSYTVTNADLVASGDAYGYLSSQNGWRRGIDQIDNLSFSAIPEPSTYVSLFGVMALLFVGARRYRG